MVIMIEKNGEKMSIFICKVNYMASSEAVERVRGEHRAYLAEFYKKGNLLLSGPRIPREGGLIVAKFNNKDEVLEFSKNDPFVKQNIAEYEIIECEVAMCDKSLERFLM